MSRIEPPFDEVEVGTDINLLRVEAHAVFDLLWEEGFMERTHAYEWLAKAMGLLPYEAHMAKMNAAQCREVIRLSEEKLKELRNGREKSHRGDAPSSKTSPPTD